MQRREGSSYLDRATIAGILGGGSADVYNTTPTMQSEAFGMTVGRMLLDIFCDGYEEDEPENKEREKAAVNEEQEKENENENESIVKAALRPRWASIPQGSWVWSMCTTRRFFSDSCTSQLGGLSCFGRLAHLSNEGGRERTELSESWGTSRTKTEGNGREQSSGGRGYRYHWRQ